MYYLTKAGVNLIDEARGDQYGANVAWPGEKGSLTTDAPPKRSGRFTTVVRSLLGVPTRATQHARKLRAFRATRNEDNINETPIIDDEGRVIKTKINTRFRNVLIHGDHSGKLVKKSLDAADAKRAQLEKAAKRVHISKANKKVRKAFSDKFFPHGGGTANILPGMQSNRPAAPGETRTPTTILTLRR